MTTAAEALSEFTYNLKYEDLSNGVVKKSKQLLLDTLGCALGGYLSEPSRIVRSMVKDLGGRPEATVIGSGDRTSSPNAVLANCVMVRYLDFMDIYFNKDGCHPSENIPTALAVGERTQALGKDLLTAIVIGFEIQQRFADAIPCHLLQWHHVTIAGYVTPLIAGKLLGLNQDQLTHAVGISGSHNHALADLLGEWWRGTGQISMMKAIGYGFGSQSGIIAALLAQKGFTGPNTIIESFGRVVAKEENLAPIISGGDRFKILDTSLKAYPSEYLSQSSLDAMFELIRKHNIQAEDVEAINIKTHSYVSILTQLSSYKPETRESADHSLPYCLAVGLIEGELGPDQFKREQWKDPKVLDLMSRIKIEIDKELSALYPPARPVILEIRIKNGECYKTRVDYPRGDPHNPMTDKETEAKFKKLAGNLIQESQMREIIDLVNHIEEISNVSELMEHLVV